MIQASFTTPVQVANMPAHLVAPMPAHMLDALFADAARIDPATGESTAPPPPPVPTPRVTPRSDLSAWVAPRQEIQLILRQNRRQELLATNKRYKTSIFEGLPWDILKMIYGMVLSHQRQTIEHHIEFTAPRCGLHMSKRQSDETDMHYSEVMNSNLLTQQEMWRAREMKPPSIKLHNDDYQHRLTWRKLAMLGEIRLLHAVAEKKKKPWSKVIKYKYWKGLTKYNPTAQSARDGWGDVSRVRDGYEQYNSWGLGNPNNALPPVVHTVSTPPTEISITKICKILGIPRPEFGQDCTAIHPSEAKLNIDFGCGKEGTNYRRENAIGPRPQGM